jgi:hypothetical protein
MCLTGVDYFSTLGYQPSIAFLAAGFLSPFATLVLVLLTLFGALPVYTASRRSARTDKAACRCSKSAAALARQGVVLCLLGFAATSFIITITLSRPTPRRTSSRTRSSREPRPSDVVTLRWSRARRGVPERLPRSDLARGGARPGVPRRQRRRHRYELVEVLAHPTVLAEDSAICSRSRQPVMIVRARRRAVSQTGARPVGLRDRRGRDAAGARRRRHGSEDCGRASPTRRKLLTSAALIMSVLLIGSSIVTTTMIPTRRCREAARRRPRARVSRASRLRRRVRDGVRPGDDRHAVVCRRVGHGRLLNLVPQYLPRYGMAPDWARATRPLVLLITIIAAS